MHDASTSRMPQSSRDVRSLVAFKRKSIDGSEPYCNHLLLLFIAFASAWCLAACGHPSVVILNVFGTRNYVWPWKNLHVPHPGVDFASKKDVVLAVDDGRVISMQETSVGTTVWIYHSGLERKVLYGHLVDVRVHTGDYVTRGQRIARMWSTVRQQWRRHVHLGICRSAGCDAGWYDPLLLIHHCLSESVFQEPVFPVLC
jgi:murein DD-endopeptidase MepM/ murein hydrolase activator NlpD